VNAVLAVGTNVPLTPLCTALGASRATVYRRKRPAPPKASRAKPARALDDDAKQAIIQELCSPRFIDRSPSEVFHTLLDEDKYLGSERTMYRVLAERDEVKERRNQRVHPPYSRPELMATGPNQVWSWDISRLQTTAKWTYFHLYVVLDIFSRYVVGWMIARHENAALAKELIKESHSKHDIQPGHLILHADRGTQMTSKTLAQLLVDLDVATSFNRPHVSNDNPFSESQFKTAKYHPSYPGKFSAIEDALAWGREFFPWYNDAHKHSGIAFLTPADVHYGRADDVLARRHLARLKGYEAHPERFPHGRPKPTAVPNAVYINPPKALDVTSAGAEPAVRAGAPDDAFGERQPPTGGHHSADHLAPPTQELAH
jgi:putative transposase